MVLNLFAAMWLMTLPMLLLAVPATVLDKTTLSTVLEFGSVSLHCTTMGTMPWLDTQHGTRLSRVATR